MGKIASPGEAILPKAVLPIFQFDGNEKAEYGCVGKIAKRVLGETNNVAGYLSRSFLERTENRKTQGNPTGCVESCFLSFQDKEATN